MSARPHLLALILLVLLSSVAYRLFPHNPPAAPTLIERVCHTDAHGRDLTAGNSTLGFEAIVALSTGTKWRVDGLRAAADISRLDIHIPAHVKWSEDFTKIFRSLFVKAGHGDSLAWLGHLGLLRLIVQNRWASALIIEDDADWSIDIRSQMVQVAEAVRTITKQHSYHTSDHTYSPYGLDWDVLWIGHCGEAYNMERPLVIYDDPTVIPLKWYWHGMNDDIPMSRLIRNRQRVVQFSASPYCTFAYAVSARGAQKLLAEAMAPTGNIIAFDVLVSKLCKKRLNCITVTPEIVTVHWGGLSEIGIINKEQPGMGCDIPRGKTVNILRSARCYGLFGRNCLHKYKNWRKH